VDYTQEDNLSEISDPNALLNSLNAGLSLGNTVLRNNGNVMKAVTAATPIANTAARTGLLQASTSYAGMPQTVTDLASQGLTAVETEGLKQVGAKATEQALANSGNGLSSAAQSGIGAGIALAGNLAKPLISDGLQTSTGDNIG